MQAQTRNDQMQGILTADLLPATDRNLAIEVYNTDAASIGAVAATVPYTVTRVNTAPTLYSLASDAVTVSAAGIYMVTYHVTLGHDSGTDEAVGAFWLEANVGGAGFLEVTATKTFVPILGYSYGSGQETVILRIAAGNVYRVRGQRTHGNDALIVLGAGANRLSLVCLFLTP